MEYDGNKLLDVRRPHRFPKRWQQIYALQAIQVKDLACEFFVIHVANYQLRAVGRTTREQQLDLAMRRDKNKRAYEFLDVVNPPHEWLRSPK